MKTVAVKIAGEGREPLDITIKPGTTAGEILTQLNLEDYALSCRPIPDRFLDDYQFTNHEEVYPQLMDSQRIFAIPF